MRRLKDLDEPTSPIESDAVDLLRAAAGYEPPAGQKQRVRARLLQMRVTRRRTVFRPAVIVAVLLCAAAAGATVGRRWIAQTLEVLVTPVTHRSPAAARTPSTRGTSDDRIDDRAAVTMAEAPEAVRQPNDVAPPTEIVAVATDGIANAAVRIHSHRKTGRGTNHLSVARLAAAARTAKSTMTTKTAATKTATATTTMATHEGPLASGPVGAAHLVSVDATAGSVQDANARFMAADAASGAAGYAAGRIAGRAKAPEVAPQNSRSDAAASPSSDETGLVFEAMRALRQDKRPARATRLLDQYLRRHPDGSLSEEALALSIEAAEARGDDARASDLIRTYRDHYPSGHFRAAVEATRARLSP